jgi:hypothetical protein
MVSASLKGAVPRLFLSVSEAVEASGLSRSVLYESCGPEKSPT